VAGQALEFQSRPGFVTFTLPLLREFESIAVHHRAERRP
jgi:hypothetical protein